MVKFKQHPFLSSFLLLTILAIIFPLIILLIWVFTNKWPWPNLLPIEYSLRAIEQVLAPHNYIFKILLSSMLISTIVALLSVIVAIMTARALVYYDFRGKLIINIFSFAPLLVPGVVFAMGIHVIFIKLSLANTIIGVIIVHLIYTLPYSVNIMKSLTASVGKKMEFQAHVLGATPFKALVYVYLPLLKRGIVTCLTMAYILSFSQYFLTLLIGGGQVKTFTLLMVPYIATGDRMLGSAYASVFIISTLAVFLIFDSLLKKSGD